MDKFNFLQTVESMTKDEIKKFIIDFLVKRKVEKNLIYTLTQVELRSLGMPGIKFISELVGDYYKFSKGLGFINKYDNFNKWTESIKLNKRRKIFIDTREQTPLKFKKVNTEVCTLSYGDYAFSDEEWTDRILIERKSLNDLIGTLVSGYDRFTREIERAEKDNAYLIILIEEKLSNSLDYKKKKLVHYKCRIPPQIVFHNIRQLIQKYKNIQFVFSDSHKDSGKLVETFFSLGSQIKNYDLQLLVDLNII